MCSCASETWRLLQCRWCHQIQTLCPDCDRGQKNCTDECASGSRRAQQRAASRAYPRDPRAKRRRAAREQRRRDRIGAAKFPAQIVAQQCWTEASTGLTRGSPSDADCPVDGGAMEAPADVSSLAMYPAREPDGSDAARHRLDPRSAEGSARSPTEPPPSAAHAARRLEPVARTAAPRCSLCGLRLPRWARIDRTGQRAVASRKLLGPFRCRAPVRPKRLDGVGDFQWMRQLARSCGQ